MHSPRSINTHTHSDVFFFSSATFSPGLQMGFGFGFGGFFQFFLIMTLVSIVFTVISTAANKKDDDRF